MTLKEKFKKIDIKLSESHSTLITNREADIMETIAEDFAIAYSVWFCEQIKDDKMDNYSLEELLEIYKKEKGL